MASVLASSTTRMILGLGETGTSVARWFVSQGIEFLATDTRPEVLTSAPVRDAVGSDRRLVAAEDVPAALKRVNELIVSPGIPLEHPWVEEAQTTGARIIGDIDLFIVEAAAPVIGITGSNGKSTVAALVAHMIET